MPERSGNFTQNKTTQEKASLVQGGAFKDDFVY
jgi:hypothetical protein